MLGVMRTLLNGLTMADGAPIRLRAQRVVDYVRLPQSERYVTVEEYKNELDPGTGE